MKLSVEDTNKRIIRYLNKNDFHPRFVNICDPKTLNEFITRFAVGSTKVFSVSDFSRNDENYAVENLSYELAEITDPVFLVGFTSFYKLFGEDKLIDFLNRISGMSRFGLHLVVVCYKCGDQLKKLDSRYRQFVYDIGDDNNKLPKLIFTSQSMPLKEEWKTADGIDNAISLIESSNANVLYVRTKKKKASYPYSMYQLEDRDTAFKMLSIADPMVNASLRESYGTDKQWENALAIEYDKESWTKYLSSEFSSNLSDSAPSWKIWSKEKRWDYFIALKLFGARDNWCLNEAIQRSNNDSELIRNIYRSILTLHHDAPDFNKKYKERRSLIEAFGILEDEVVDYCSIVRSKEKDAIYYLTDLTSTERNLIFELLDRYAGQYTFEQISNSMKYVYPDLYYYLQPFKFNNDLLDSYFEKYKYQKVINHMIPGFDKIVEEQAKKREYNLILPSRSEAVDKIEKKDTIVYFIDAMGVEYLSFIVAECNKKHLIADVSVCRCELPSITSFNKEFVSEFEDGGATFVPDKNGIKELDDHKHHGKAEYDFTNNKLPTYLAEELNIIKTVIDKASIKLKKGEYQRAVIISDHGASRLCVLNGKENKWEMTQRGEHSGRCCPVSDIDDQPPCSTKENGYWVLANYDRFKGGRAANIEVHGGATLEEVTVPVIELTYSSDEIEIFLKENEIAFTRRKKDATVRIFSKTKLKKLSIRVSELNQEYEGISEDGQNFNIAIPDLNKSGIYHFDVYLGSNCLKSGMEFSAKNKAFSEKDIL